MSSKQNDRHIIWSDIHLDFEDWRADLEEQYPDPLAEVFGEETAAGIRVLYGGSAKPENIAGFLEKEDVDGALVGGASLKADSFAAMVKSAMA